MPPRINVIRAWAVLLLVTALPAVTFADASLTVAVASNFQITARKIALRFSESTGIEVRIIAGSTGKLYAQIVNGAPYDVFLAGDTERPAKLVEDTVADSESYLIYATGYLVLWSNNPKFVGRDCYADLMQSDFSYLSIANPNTAPYGLAAQKFLSESGLWDVVQEKLVFGENISQAFQFVASKNATMGLIAASQVAGQIPFETTCYQPLLTGTGERISVRQAGVILAQTRNSNAAQRFMEFMQTPGIVALMQNSGYGAPIVASDGW